MTEPVSLHTTYDGLPISPVPPFGASIIVYRYTQQGIEYLILHRAHDGPDFEGDWAWTPPAGSRLPDEPIDTCARRELLEETGLSLPIDAIDVGERAWAIYRAEATLAEVVMLDAEHDRYEWVNLEIALARCLPAVVGEAVQMVARVITS